MDVSGHERSRQLDTRGSWQLQIDIKFNMSWTSFGLVCLAGVDSEPIQTQWKLIGVSVCERLGPSNGLKIQWLLRLMGNLGRSRTLMDDLGPQKLYNHGRSWWMQNQFNPQKLDAYGRSWKLPDANRHPIQLNFNWCFCCKMDGSRIWASMRVLPPPHVEL